METKKSSGQRQILHEKHLPKKKTLLTSKLSLDLKETNKVLCLEHISVRIKEMDSKKGRHEQSAEF